MGVGWEGWVVVKGDCQGRLWLSGHYPSVHVWVHVQLFTEHCSVHLVRTLSFSTWCGALSSQHNFITHNCGMRRHSCLNEKWEFHYFALKINLTLFDQHFPKNWILFPPLWILKYIGDVWGSVAHVGGFLLWFLMVLKRFSVVFSMFWTLYWIRFGPLWILKYIGDVWGSVAHVGGFLLWFLMVLKRFSVVFSMFWTLYWIRFGPLWILKYIGDVWGSVAHVGFFFVVSSGFWWF